jgi:hypothetical protein
MAALEIDDDECRAFALVSPNNTRVLARDERVRKKNVHARGGR